MTNTGITLRRVAALLFAAICFAGVARADLVDLDMFTSPGPIGNPGEEADWIEGDQGLMYDLMYLYKDEEGSPAEDPGAVDGSFFTIVYNFDGEDRVSATLSWDLTGTGYELHYILLKDGTIPNPTPPPNNVHVYHLYGVTPSQYVVGDSSNLTGGVVTIDGEKNISHITFFGVAGGPSVPDGGLTLGLLGLAMAVIAGFRRHMHI